jgi:hypothetical protein
LEHSGKRRFDNGLVFDPAYQGSDYYNLWRGFAVKPKPVDCAEFLARSKFLQHLRDNVVKGNEDHFKWLQGWIAQPFQQPALKLGTAVALQGKEGIGKSKVGEVVGSLLGDHYFLADHRDLITGHFNAHLANVLLLHADEAFWAGDKQAEGKLKNLVTCRTLPITYKGRDSFSIDNFTRVLVASNSDWVVPASGEARRWAVWEVSDAHMRDYAYFKAIDDELDRGGREELLYYFLNFDLSQVNLREVPKTDALLVQKQLTFTMEESFLHQLFAEGELPWATRTETDDLPNVCPREMLMNAYVVFATQRASRAMRVSTDYMGRIIRKVIPDMAPEEKMTYLRGREKAHGRVYRFPDLATCRRRFDEYVQQKMPWDEQVDWEFRFVPGQGDHDGEPL